MSSLKNITITKWFKFKLENDKNHNCVTQKHLKLSKSQYEKLPRNNFHGGFVTGHVTIFSGFEQMLVLTRKKFSLVG